MHVLVYNDELRLRPSYVMLIYAASIIDIFIRNMCVARGRVLVKLVFAWARKVVAGILILTLGPYLVGCASGEQQPLVQASHMTTPTTALPVAEEVDSPLGSYLAGRIARKQNDMASAAKYFGHALKSDPDNQALLRETFMAALSDGHFSDAIDLAGRLNAIGVKVPYASLVSGAENFKNDDFEGANAALSNLKRRGYNVLLVPLLKAWSAVGSNDFEGAHRELRPLTHTQAFYVFEKFHSALISDLEGDNEAAEEAYREVMERQPGGTLRTVAAFAGLFERSGRPDEADELYRDYQDNNPDSISFQRVLDRLSTDRASERTVRNAREGAAEALFGVASALYQENATEPALLYGRMAIYLRQDFDAAHLFLGQLLEGQERPEQAIASYRSVSKESPLYWTARLRIATSLDSLEQTDKAVDELSNMAQERVERADALITLGDLLRSQQRWSEAADAYDLAFNRIGDLQPRHWRPLYARGISLERSKQWSRAEADFLKALELEPDQPFVLNYLGYSWVDQGTHLQRALKMIERAVDLRPNDGYIIDSLGWALYRLGNYDDSVTQLERAVELRPDDPTINDHLGDAYWRVGRVSEARFQWRRALVLEPEDEQISDIKAKIANGLAPLASGDEEI